MPFKSAAQRRYMYAMHPDIARRWSAEERRKVTKAKATRDLEELKADLKDSDDVSAKMVAVSSAVGATAGPAAVRAAGGAAGKRAVEEARARLVPVVRRLVRRRR